MNGKTSEQARKTPVPRPAQGLLDDPGNEDPGSQLDAPVPLRPSTRSQRQKKPRPDAGEPR